MPRVGQEELCKVIHELGSYNQEVLAEKLGISDSEAYQFGVFMTEIDKTFCNCKTYWGRKV